MLIKLAVQNYALIRDLDVEFEKGLTIITGETGAGKTILLGALSLILGSRADSGVLLDKNEKCIVEGVFRIDDYDLEGFFRKNDLDYEPVTTLRREINPAGKSRAFINDTPVNLNVLKEIGDRLIDIHSQHQTLMLKEESFTLEIVDSFAGTGEMKADYKRRYANYLELRNQYFSAKEKAEKNKSDLEYFQFQLRQLEEAKLIDGEQESLEKEQKMLEHSGEIKTLLGASSELFSGEGASVTGMLREIRNNLSKIQAFLPGGESLFSRTDSSLIELSDIAAEVEKLVQSFDTDPERLGFVSERLDLIYSLLQKHRVADLHELITKREQIRENVTSIMTSDETVAGLEKKLAESEIGLRNSANELSEKRKSVVREIETKVSDLLKQLGMPNARFIVKISRLDLFTNSGVDQVDFFFTANKQVPPEDLAKVASGGELSRVMLSLKSLLTRYNNLPTIIFDEIDSGVSGEVADKVGQILSGMGKYMQVVNITHLPQVASRGTRHYHVYKDDTTDTTITRVRLLTAEERVTEVARLLSGSEVTEAAVRNARELLGAAN